MQNRLSWEKGTPYPLGATKTAKGVNFAVRMNREEAGGVLLYEKDTKRLLAKVAFTDTERRGNVYCGLLKNLKTEECVYNFYNCEGNMGRECQREYVDPYAKVICGTKKLYGMFASDETYAWEEDKLPELSYADSIFYLLHVRGFTKHHSSGVKHRGTFLGIQEKIPYLKELGVTTLELMPVYEFEERETIPENEIAIPDYMQERYKNAREVLRAAQKNTPDGETESRRTAHRVNYWGYKAGHYFVPKRSYAAGERPDIEFKNLVKELHRNGMEIILQFYFPTTVKQGFLIDVLQYWIQEYHIDGIHLKGVNMPVSLLATEGWMADRKLLSENLVLSEIYEEKEQPTYQNLAFYRDDFMYEVRKFLKGDDNMLPAFTDYSRRNEKKAGVINFMTNYYGFTLEDMVSYDRKHNEENGEDNQDGTDFNFSWNCGVEGKTRKKSINALRLRQKKNALAMLFFSQGTPLLRAGDEFGHSQKGNNNAYCQDNEISWLNWGNLDKQREFYDYVRELIAIRNRETMLHREAPLAMNDYQKLGYPELSLHGEEAWKVRMAGYDHEIGMLYCGRYMDQENWLYVAYNMHWQEHDFGLPGLPETEEWKLCLTTGEEPPALTGLEEGKKEGQHVRVPARTICLFQSSKRQVEKQKKRKKKE